MSRLPAASHDPAAETRWDQARRTAFVQDLLSSLTHRPAELLPFEEVRQKLHLINMHYLGLQEVPLDQIVGSVGRYHDFTRAFFPRSEGLKDRWKRIDQLISTGSGIPPVELYKVGQAYFVQDGNHRVSVARQHRLSSIEAYVWEFPTHLPLDADTDIDELLCRDAHAVFMERTHLDQLCPTLSIKLTQPDAYTDLLHEIEAHQQILSTIDERELPFDEAVVLWSEMRYTPVVEVIRQQYVLQEFPGRTETDLYMWLCHNQQELATSYQGSVLMETAADDLVQRFSPRTVSLRLFRQSIGRATAGVVNRAAGWWSKTRWSRKRNKIGPNAAVGQNQGADQEVGIDDGHQSPE